MDDLITWLKACLDEDEKAATVIFRDHTWAAYLEGGNDGWAVEGAHSGEPSCMVGDEAMAAHIARWDPARVLREVEAKRELLREHQDTGIGVCGTCVDWMNDHLKWPCRTVRVLALPFSDRPGYQEGWRP